MPADSSFFVNRGDLYGDRGDYKEAIEDLSQAIHLHPDDAIVWNNRCWYRAIQGDLNPALDDCNQALAMDADNSYTLDSRGFVYLKMKFVNKAVADYRAALAIAPKTPTSLYGLGLAEQLRGDRGAANEHLIEAKKLQPDIADQFVKWGVPTASKPGWGHSPNTPKPMPLVAGRAFKTVIAK